MPKVNDLIRKRLLKDVHERVPGLETLWQTERSREFDRLRMNRKILGGIRYGLLGEEGKVLYNRVDNMIDRLRRYKEDPNKEYLVDVANLCECEWVEGEGYFEGTDEHDFHTEEK